MTFSSDWSRLAVAEDVRAGGSRLAILGSDGELLEEPVNASALGARFPVEIGHLERRMDGVSWASIDGPGASTATLVRLRCRLA